MNVFEFMSNSPWLTFFLAVIIASVVQWPFRLISRWIAHRNIIAKGWPPAHVDAHGNEIRKDAA